MEERKAIIAGISGCSSSGKTTLARILRDIFPQTFILHEDDFYKPEAELPTKGRHVDWDSVDSLNVAQMEKSLAHIRSTGTFPPDLDSREDQNAVGKCPVSDTIVSAMKDKVASWVADGQPGHDVFVTKGLKLCLLDGFLLYSPAMERVMGNIDVKLFLLVSRDTTLRRRKARAGYVTLEGFWTDPEGYVEEVVWPNYAEAHAWLFENGDVEGGVLDEETLSEKDIQVLPGKQHDVDMDISLEWAVEILMRELPRVV